MGIYSTEYVLSKYPQLPADAAESIAQTYISPESLSKVGGTWGVRHVTQSKVYRRLPYFRLGLTRIRALLKKSRFLM